MPVISRFYGIKVVMLYDDHAPPHFHIYYNDYRAKFSIQNQEMLEGYLPSRAAKMVQEWARIFEKELLIDWELARQHKVLNSIDSLE